VSVTEVLANKHREHRNEPLAEMSAASLFCTITS